MTTPLIGPLSYAGYAVEATMGTIPTNAAVPATNLFGLNVSVSNARIEQELSQIPVLGSRVAYANNPGAWSASFTLDFDMISGATPLAFLTALIGTAPATKTTTAMDISANTFTLANHGLVSGTPIIYLAASDKYGVVKNTVYYVGVVSTSLFSLYTDPSLTAILDISGTYTTAIGFTHGLWAKTPNTLTIALINDITQGSPAEWAYLFGGCMITNFTMNVQQGEAVHCTVDVICSTVSFVESGAARTVPTQTGTIYTYLHGSFGGATNIGSDCAVESASISITSDASYKGGIGSKLPQTRNPGMLKATMNMSLIYEVGKGHTNYALGADGAVAPAAQTIANPLMYLNLNSTTDICRICLVDGYISSLGDKVDVTDAIMQDIDLTALSVHILTGTKG